MRTESVELITPPQTNMHSTIELGLAIARLVAPGSDMVFPQHVHTDLSDCPTTSAVCNVSVSADGTSAHQLGKGTETYFIDLYISPLEVSLDKSVF